MKAPIIADSSALVSLVSPGDQNNARAVAISQRLAQAGRDVLIPADVFVETMNVLGKLAGHAAAHAVGERLRSGSEEGFLVVESADVYAAALAAFRDQPASVSFTDCIVMAVADHFTTREVFGFDEVFRKNGYELREEAPAA